MKRGRVCQIYNFLFLKPWLPSRFGTLTGMLFVTGEEKEGPPIKFSLSVSPRLLPHRFSNVPLCLFFLISVVMHALICMREMCLSFKCYVNLPRQRQNTRVGFIPSAFSNKLCAQAPENLNYCNDTPHLPPFIFISEAMACWFKREVRQKHGCLKLVFFTVVDRAAGATFVFRVIWHSCIVALSTKP